VACNQGDKMTSQRQLVGQGQGGLTPLPEDGQGVVIGIEALTRAGHIVGGDHVQPLTSQFVEGVLLHIHGFGGKSDGEGLV
jgi:hypothetical protein